MRHLLSLLTAADANEVISSRTQSIDMILDFFHHYCTLRYLSLKSARYSAEDLKQKGVCMTNVEPRQSKLSFAGTSQHV